MSYRFIDEEGIEQGPLTPDQLVTAINQGKVAKATLVDAGDGRWVSAASVFPSVFEASARQTTPRTDETSTAARRSLFWLLGPLSLGYFVSSLQWADDPSVASHLGYASGHTIVAAFLGWLFTRVPRRARGHWPMAAMVPSLLIVGLIVADQAEMRDALDELDATAEALAGDLRAGIGTVETPRVSDRQAEALLVQAMTSVLTSLSAFGDSLAIEYQVASEPDPMWLEPAYYASPSHYPHVRSYFERYSQLVARLAQETRSESQVRNRIEAELRAAGVNHPIQLRELSDDTWRGWVNSLPSQDTTYQVMQDYSAAAMALHDGLIRIEGSLRVDASGEMEWLDARYSESIIRLDTRVSELALALIERTELAAARMESMADSLRRAIR